jgi:phosphoglycerol transferase MdoB-like AlkP superfamily enzyme
MMNDVSSQNDSNGFETKSRSQQDLSEKILQRQRQRSLSSRGVWGRIGLLLTVLCLTKIWVLVTFRKYLFEIHWRIKSNAPHWWNEAAFYLFAGLIGLHLWTLARRAQKSDVKTVRLINGCVLALGTVFIFLTFHVMNRNYLSPIMNGILTWKSLGSYFSMDFFFWQPYLAAWIFVYALVYYVLARTGREGKVLMATAVFAALYTALNLKSFVDFRNAIIILDCVGLASLPGSFRAGQRPLSPLWIYSLPILMISLFVLFHPFDDSIRLPNSEFILLSLGGIVLFAGVTLLIRQRGGYAVWSWSLPFALTSFLLLINTHYAMADNYNNLLCLGLVLPHYFLGEFSLAAGLFAIAFCYRRLLPRASLWWLDVVNVLLICLALVDLRLSQIMGVRLDWQVLQFGNSPKMMWRLARPYLPVFFVVLAALVAVYLVALRALRKWSERTGGFQTKPSGGQLFALMAFVLLGLVGSRFAIQDKAEGQTTLLLAETNPLWRRAEDPPMSREKFLKTAKQLGIPLLDKPAAAVAAAAAPPRDLNVVLIFQESSYNEYLSLFDGKIDTEPLLSQYKNRMELFPNFFSNFAASMNARFATFTGLYPVMNVADFTEKHVPVKSIFGILHDHGYACSLFYSSYLDYTGFRDFLRGRGLDPYYGATTMPVPHKLPPVTWGLREEETLAAMQDQIKKYAAEKKKFFMTYVPAAPHNPFDVTPDRFRKFKIQQMGDFTPLYLNSLDYMDWIIASLIDQLKTSGLLNNTLVIITDDHGEMLGQNGGPTGHGWAVTPKLTNIPLIIMDPAHPGYHINDAIGSQVDLLPTILDRLHIPLPAGQIYEGTSLDSANPESGRFIYLNSFSQYGIIHGNHLICGDRETGEANAATLDKNYDITNQAARTFFPKTDDPDFSLPNISEFDTFQKSLLAHYAYYCQMLQPSSGGQ